MNSEKQIIDKKLYGDIKLVARMLNVSAQNAQKILSRPKSKKYQQAVNALNQIVQAREALLAPKD